MNPIDSQLNALVSLLRARGAHIGIDPDAPDYVKEAFLRVLMECPDCQSFMRMPNDIRSS